MHIGRMNVPGGAWGSEHRHRHSHRDRRDPLARGRPPARHVAVRADRRGPVRRRPGHVRPAVQHAGGAARPRRRVRPDVGRQHPRRLGDDRRARRRAAGGRPDLGPLGAHRADPHLARRVRRGGRAVRARADVAGPAGPAVRRGSRARRAAGRRDGLPARGTAPGVPGPRSGPLHRRDRPGRHDRTPAHRRRRGRRRLALVPGRRRPPGRGLCGRGPAAAAGLPAVRAGGARGGGAVDAVPGGVVRPRAGGPVSDRRARDGRAGGHVQHDRVPADGRALRAQPGRGEPVVLCVPGGLGLLDGGRTPRRCVRLPGRAPDRLADRDRGARLDAVGLAAGDRRRAGPRGGRVLRRARRRQRLGAGARVRRGHRDRAGGVAVPVQLLPGLVGLRDAGRHRLRGLRLARRRGRERGPVRGGGRPGVLPQALRGAARARRSERPGSGRLRTGWPDAGVAACETPADGRVGRPRPGVLGACAAGPGICRRRPLRWRP